MGNAMNRRGHIPTFMLFIVALVLVGFAIFIFLTAGTNFSERSDELSALILEIGFKESYVQRVLSIVVEDSLRSVGNGLSGSEFLDRFDGEFKLESDGKDVWQGEFGNVFGKIRSGDYSLEELDGHYVLKIEDLFVKASNGGGEIKKNFDLEIEFDENGLLPRF